MIKIVEPDNSPLHRCPLCIDAVGVLAVMVDGRGRPVKIEWNSDGVVEDDGKFYPCVAQLKRWLEGEDTDIEVAPRGLSPLGLAVLKVLAAIMPGEVMSYSEVAVYAGYPRAVRAVATAVGHNPLPVIIPCHRVLPKPAVERWRNNRDEVLLRGVDIGHYTPCDDIKAMLLRHDMSLTGRTD